MSAADDTDDYDAEIDFTESINECYRAIRARVAGGGPGWGGWPADPFAELPHHHYRAILVDPPWKFRTYTDAPNSRGAENHYATMTLDQIKALPVRELAARDAHLFLWTTGPFLSHSLDVLRAWGFRFSTLAFTWVKLRRGFQQLSFLPLVDSALHVGTGHTTRKNCEFVILGRRGEPRREARDVREIILSPVREHSRKPDELYSRIERYSAGPYLELFARQRRPGWTVWGNEVGLFVEA